VVERINRERTRRSKGSQPVVFADETTDALAAMVLALLGEVVVLKDRLDANERLLAEAGLHSPATVDSFAPDESARADRGTYRQAIYERVLGAARDKLLPETLTQQRDYDGVLRDVAAT
jgi:hypothetical protein